MTTYAIGDVQGCYQALDQLLDKIAFSPGYDRLWFTGDLVNRGPRSLEVLRFVKSLGDTAITVLGNHDLHLLAIAAGHAPVKKFDTIDDVLAAPDSDELLHWLQQRPLMHHEAALGYTLVHAGIYPQWSVSKALVLAAEVESALRGDAASEFFSHMYSNEPALWRDTLDHHARLCFITNVFTRMRYCLADGSLDMYEKGAPDKARGGLLPWFKMSRSNPWPGTIVFGHWSTLDIYHGDGVISLDSGCHWGGKLTALVLDDLKLMQLHQLACEPQQIE
ncbi:MAG TPA: symmetrical bis(5'-nucleosyl)-tetraphosphatase [Acidiferrobacteraceae bacterium]|nr:symmetrical bis(5'-nucleosyl)-tetraphosphatase [Acidiferrobacteraceae bacterium]HEX20025.1 symmetrical bis(5'-nucleosyl)-tetraphosphatase [Acidiferrobacteraceae bacterium]